MNQSLHEFVIEYTARAALSTSTYAKLVRDLAQFDEGEAAGGGDRQAAQVVDAHRGGGKQQSVQRRKESRGANLLLESLKPICAALGTNHYDEFFVHHGGLGP